MIQASLIKLSDVYKTFVSKAQGILSAHNPRQNAIEDSVEKTRGHPLILEHVSLLNLNGLSFFNNTFFFF